MWITYSDSEVQVYHPICERALNNALENIGKQSEYEVLHHHFAGSLEMDFAIRSKQTKKYICVIEVKRTQVDVQSIRYQYQAMSYVQTIKTEMAEPFYILTNLERIMMFRYDNSRPNVYQQILQPGLIEVENFNKTPQEDFEIKLAAAFSDRITSILSRNYSYELTMEKFATQMGSVKDNTKTWKSDLALLLYEYIRGAFTSIKRKGLNRDVRAYSNNIESICKAVSGLNFKEIFNYSTATFDEHVELEDEIVTDMYLLGNRNVSADQIAILLHQIVSSGFEHDGEVATDPELARYVSLLAKHIHGDLSDEGKVCDPAAGSGNLISSAIEVFKLKPYQIKANDIKRTLVELLTIKLGLNYPRIIADGNSPAVSIMDAADLPKDYFEDIDIIVMNPPFVAGISCTLKKAKIFERIRLLSGKDPLTEIGQIGLEVAFLELICEQVKHGTTISCILPKTHLTARSAEASALRTLLIEKFGLKLIFAYPGEDLFDGVDKDTCIFVGKKGQNDGSIKVLSSYSKITDINMQLLEKALNEQTAQSEFSPFIPGVEAREVSIDELKMSISDGWRKTSSETCDAIDYIKDNLEKNNKVVTILNAKLSFQRGRAGNTGCSALLFIDTKQDFYTRHKDEIGITKPSMKNAKFDKIQIEDGDSKFLDIRTLGKVVLDGIIDDYVKSSKSTGRQPRKEKTKDEIVDILTREASGEFLPFSVLIPRAIREKGRVFYSDRNIYISTNFLVFQSLEKKDALIIASWMTTIFYQLNCEVSSKNQEGMRKQEEADIERTLIPDPSIVDPQTFKAIEGAFSNIQFLDLMKPIVRDIDNIWASYLFGSRASELTENARNILELMARRRNK